MLCKQPAVTKDRDVHRHCLISFGALVGRIVNSRDILQRPEALAALREYRQVRHNYCEICLGDVKVI